MNYGKESTQQNFKEAHHAHTETLKGDSRLRKEKLSLEGEV